MGWSESNLRLSASCTSRNKPPLTPQILHEACHVHKAWHELLAFSPIKKGAGGPMWGWADYKSGVRATINGIGSPETGPPSWKRPKQTNKPKPENSQKSRGQGEGCETFHRSRNVKTSQLYSDFKRPADFSECLGRSRRSASPSQCPGTAARHLTGTYATCLSLINGSAFFSGPGLPKERSESRSKLSPQQHSTPLSKSCSSLLIVCGADSLLTPYFCLSSLHTNTRVTFLTQIWPLSRA